MLLDVLIVDDSTAIRRMLNRVLRETDLPIGQIYEAADGLEALAEIDQHNIGLILSDINMPNMDGLELLSRVKAIPLYIIASEAVHHRAMEAIEWGAAGYIRRPFTTEQIEGALASLLVAA